MEFQLSIWSEIISAPISMGKLYLATYSEYFWGLEAKLNIAWSPDINARTIIEIV
jgi:hypothetical protein